MPRRLAPFCAAVLAWSAPPEPDFRQVSWGMSEAQVRASEEGWPSESRTSAGETILTYESVALEGLPCRLVYVFEGGGLVRAKYLFTARHDDPDGYVADFKAVDPALRERYGAPAIDRALWEDDDHQTERKAYLDQDRATPGDLLSSDAFLGVTLAAGNLKLRVEWESGGTRILHALAAVGNLILHQIEYRAAATDPR
jgi:hypothetical protein